MKKYILIMLSLMLVGCQTQSIKEDPLKIEDQNNPLYLITVDDQAYTLNANYSIHASIVDNCILTNLKTMEDTMMEGNLTIHQIGINATFGDILSGYHLKANQATISYFPSKALDDYKMEIYDGTLPDLTKHMNITITINYNFENDHWSILDLSNDQISNHPTNLQVSYSIAGLLEENENSGKVTSLALFYTRGN